jgi:hypothetical protein
MTNDHEMNHLSDELHDLADGIAPASSAARDRARRGIARHSRNRRAAVSAAAAVVVVTAAVFVVVDRESTDSGQPIGTTEPTASSAPGTTTPPTTAGSPILSTVPPLNELRAATAAYEKPFPWGTKPGQVAFQVPRGEGVSGGPVTFTADAAGNIVLLDQSNSRLVRLDQGAASARAIAGLSPAVTAATFDDQGRVIVATVSDLAVYGPNGQAEGAWQGISKGGSTIYRLEVDGRRVYSAAFSVDNLKTRTLLLSDDGSGYVAARDAAPEPDPITVDVVDDTQVGLMRISAGGIEYRITTGFKDLRAVTLRPDGSLVFVAGVAQSGIADVNTSYTYVLGRIDRAGHARYETVKTPYAYLEYGPKFDITGDGVAVMGSTTTGGLTVSYYPFT